MLKKLSILLFIFSFNSIFSQSIVGDWFFQNIQDSNGNELFEVKKTDLLSITEKDFKYNLEAKNNLLAEGSYSITNNKLSFSLAGSKKLILTPMIIPIIKAVTVL